jgi:hypothetical protein
MKPELEHELFNKYPKIFNGALIGKKIKCSNGWFHLLDSLAYDLQYICNTHPEIRQIEAVDVAEDHGSLRFLSIGGNQYTWKVIEQAEERSTFTCEECGDLGSMNYSGVYLHCLCSKHVRG